MQVKDVCEQIAFPSIILDAEQRAHLDDYLTRRYVMEGESMERQGVTTGEVKTTGERLAIMAALVELAEGGRKTLAGVDLDGLDWLLSAMQKETQEVIEDDENSTEKIRTGGPDYRMDGETLEDALTKNQEFIDKDKTALAFILWMQEQVKEAR